MIIQICNEKTEPIKQFYYPMSYKCKKNQPEQTEISFML